MNYTVNSSEPYDPVTYFLPEAFDYNFDPFWIEFNPEFWDPWAHLLAFDDRSNKLTVSPGLITEADLANLTSGFDLNFVVVDSTGLESPVYNLNIEFNITWPEA